MVRLKARYVLFEILYPTGKNQKVEGNQLMQTLRSSLETFFGEMGAGECQTTLALRYFHTNTQAGIIRIGRNQAPLIQGALTFIRTIGGVEVVVRVTHVSGTIKKCKRRALGIRKGEVVDLLEDH